MDTSVAKKTQESLGKLIKKPPLTEKLLTKPPFRFLHDVVTSVIKTTGFMQGLFTDAEMNSENVKDKDSKVAFLQKVVDIVVAVTKKSLNVRPIKIVAGHEPERTNELLQALADAINKNVDNDEYVRRVLKGDSGKDDKKEKQSKDRTKSADRRKNESDNKPEKEKEGDKGKEKEKASERGKSRGGDRHRENERESKTRDRSRDGRDERHREKSRKSFPPDQEPKASSRNRKSLSGLPIPQKTNPASTSSQKMTGAKPKQGVSPKSTVAAPKSAVIVKNKTSPSKTSSVSVNAPKVDRVRKIVVNIPGGDSHDFQTPVSPAEGPFEGGEGDIGRRDETIDSKSHGDGVMVSNPDNGDGIVDMEKAVDGDDDDDNESCRDQSKEKENESPSRQNGEKEDKQDPPPRLQRPSSAKGSRRRREGEQNGEVSEDDKGEEREGEEEREVEETVMYGRQNPAAEDEEFQKEMAPSKDAVIGDGDLPPQIAAARQLARPSSARPAPPRPKQEASESEPAMRLGGGQPANVIVDNGNDDEDDDENFLVEESAPPPPDLLEPQPMSKPTEEEDAEHGALVKKMLESKKELEGGSQTQQAAQAKKTEIERPTMSDAQRRKQREQVQKEVEKLRGSIQSLTRSANPLGKVMDYVQEDLDSMQQELDKWRQENAQLGLELKSEMNVTDRAVEPLKQQLAELEQAISDQLDQIATTKCQIIKNDTKMEKMLKSIAKS